MKLVINTDGASRGNPGPAAYGFLIKTNSGVMLHQEGKAIGIATNNIAEYTAVLKALEYIKKNLVEKTSPKVKVVSDSLLIVKQLSGKYKIKNPGLKVLFDLIKSLEIELGGAVGYEHTYRENNFLADKLANQALDKLDNF